MRDQCTCLVLTPSPAATIGVRRLYDPFVLPYVRPPESQFFLLWLGYFSGHGGTSERRRSDPERSRERERKRWEGGFTAPSRLSVLDVLHWTSAADPSLFQHELPRTRVRLQLLFLLGGGVEGGFRMCKRWALPFIDSIFGDGGVTGFQKGNVRKNFQGFLVLFFFRHRSAWETENEIITGLYKFQ